MFAIAVIGVWELARRTWTSRTARLQALRTQAQTALQTEPLNREETIEFQTLLNIDPGDLAIGQAERLLELRIRFNVGGNPRARATRQRPSTTSPPSATSSIPQHLPPPYLATASGAAPSMHPQHLPPPSLALLPQDTIASTARSHPRVTADAAIQTDQPAFEYLPPTPNPVIRLVPHEGPYHYVPGRPVMHMYRNCWGLRSAGTVNQINVCRCCAENEGRRIYPE